MNNKNKLPVADFPLTFNPYKHHLGFLKMKIEKWKNNDWKETEQEIKNIGTNLIDLYYGSLTLTEIYTEIHDFAIKLNLTSAENLAQWLNPQEYKKTSLSDSSQWVIKQGQDSSRFLHIHPAKYSPCTIRVKASTLKTVIALQAFNIDLKRCDTATVNTFRIEKLNLSPIKGLVPGKGIARLIENFNSM